MDTFKLNNTLGRLRYHNLYGRGNPIIFVHGLGCSSSCDYPQVAFHRALRSRRILLVDLLGPGFSDSPKDFGYTIDDHARTIVAFIKGMEFKKVTLVGHSMGGSIAIVVGSLYKSKIGLLVLSEPNLDSGGGTFSRTIAAQSESDYISKGHINMVQNAYRQGNDIWAKSLSLSLLVAMHREAVSLVNVCKPSWREQLMALPMPRTVLFGEYSLPDPDAKRLLEIGVKVRIIRKAGHSMAWENPGGLAQAISDSLTM